MTNLVASTAAAGASSGTSLGAAADQLRFSVAARDAAFPWPWPPWVDALLLGGALAPALVFLVRRAGPRLHVERRR